MAIGWKAAWAMCWRALPPMASRWSWWPKACRAQNCARISLFGSSRGGGQRKGKIMQNAAARNAAAQGPQDAVLLAALTESEVYAQSVQAEQDRMERQLCAEVEEARQLAAAIRASLDQGIVGSRSWGTTEGDGDVEEQFKELCEAAGVASGDIYRPTSRVPRATGAVKA